MAPKDLLIRALATWARRVLWVRAESVAVARDGSLWMLDKFGFVWRAPEDGRGSYALEKEPLAQLGPGRPLGFHFDRAGNLLVCNSGAVSPPARNMLRLQRNCTSGQLQTLKCRMARVLPVFNSDMVRSPASNML